MGSWKERRSPWRSIRSVAWKSIPEVPPVPTCTRARRTTSARWGAWRTSRRIRRATPGKWVESAMEMQGSRDGRSRPLPGESSPAGSSSLGGAGHRTPEPVRGARHGGEGRCHCVLGPGGQFLMADLLNPFFVPPNQKLFVPPGSYTLAELRGAIANHAAPAAEPGSTPIRVTRGGRRPPRPRRLGRLRGVPQFHLPSVTGAALLALAAGAGVAAFFSPCSFLLLLTLLARGASSGGRRGRTRRLGLFAAAFSAGIVGFLAALGLLVALGGRGLASSVTFVSPTGITIRNHGRATHTPRSDPGRSAPGFVPRR